MVYVSHFLSQHLNFPVAVEKAIKKSSIIKASAKTSALQHYLEVVDSKSNTEARDIAADILGERIQWDWDCKSTLFYQFEKIEPNHD